MSREIKFRVWDLDLRRMIAYDKANMDYCIANHNCENCDEGCNHVTIMQYIGLPDKNGKDIYEGDILNYGFDRVFYVTYVGCQFVATFNEKVINSMIPIHSYEVIGNIYETPELLQEAVK